MDERRTLLVVDPDRTVDEPVDDGLREEAIERDLLQRSADPAEVVTGQMDHDCVSDADLMLTD
jgi:hypothetical protein